MKLFSVNEKHEEEGSHICRIRIRMLVFETEDL